MHPMKIQNPKSKIQNPSSQTTKTTARPAANPEENFHFSPLVWALSWVVFNFLFRIWARARVRGKEHILPGGGLIAVSNHLSMIDPFFVAFVFYRNIRYMGKAELFKNRLVAWFLSWYGGFP